MSPTVPIGVLYSNPAYRHREELRADHRQALSRNTHSRTVTSRLKLKCARPVAVAPLPELRARARRWQQVPPGAAGCIIRLRLLRRYGGYRRNGPHIGAFRVTKSLCVAVAIRPAAV